MPNALNISCIKLCVRAVNCCTRNFLFFSIFKFGWHCLSSDVGADSFGLLLFSFSPYLSVTTLKIQTTLLCLNRPLYMFLFNNFFSNIKLQQSSACQIDCPGYFIGIYDFNKSTFNLVQLLFYIIFFQRKDSMCFERVNMCIQIFKLFTYFLFFTKGTEPS